MSNGFSSKINRLNQNLHEVASTTELRFDEIFTNEFLSECSSFRSLEELFEKSGFQVNSVEDFKAIPDDDWENFIIQNTTYNSWLDMQTDAVTKAISKRLTKGL